MTEIAVQIIPKPTVLDAQTAAAIPDRLPDTRYRTRQAGVQTPREIFTASELPPPRVLPELGIAR